MVRRTRYRARRRSGGRWVLAFVVACVIVAILAALIYLPRIFFSSGTPSRASDDAYCSAKLADGPSYSLMPEQAQNAELIANIAINRGLPDHAVTVAIATAMQNRESRTFPMVIWIPSDSSNSGRAKVGEPWNRCPT